MPVRFHPPAPIPSDSDCLLKPLHQGIEHCIRQHDRGFRLQARHAVGGGSVSSAWRFEGAERSYFVKLNRAVWADMFAAEADGLREIDDAAALRVPLPLCHGVLEDHAFLVCECLQLSNPGRQSAAILGSQLAIMHRHTQPRYGWRRDNTIGCTVQCNTLSSDWCVFWREQRLGYQLQLAAGNGLSPALLNKGERLMAELDSLLAGHQPAASLLHGDLWAGNRGEDEHGMPVLFDPAVYYGDREADLAMTELFSGFPDAFYAAYRESWPLDDGYAMRRTLYNLYHILNHANLFDKGSGGGYADRAKDMMDMLLAGAGS